MIGARIYDGDLLVVDRSIEPVHGQVMVATINNDMTVKCLYKWAGEVKLQAATRNFKTSLLLSLKKCQFGGGCDLQP